MNKLFIDFDGTLAEFKKTATLEEYTAAGYSKGLAPFWNLVIAVKLIIKRRLFDVYLCTKFYPYQHIVDDKNWWMDEILPEVDLDHRIFVKYEDSKVDKIMSVGISKGDIFLDDYNPNLAEIRRDIKVMEPVKFVNNINDGSHEWHGAKVRYDADPEEIVYTLLGLSLATRP